MILKGTVSYSPFSARKRKRHQEFEWMFQGSILSVPAAYLQTVCNACRFGWEVTLHEYQRIGPVVEVIHLNVDRSTGQEAPSGDDLVVLELFQVAKLEAVQQALREKTVYSLVGTVQAVSPILDPDSDPFVLVELNEDSYRCVVVLRGDALSTHAAIRPGLRLELLSVTKQLWKIPELITDIHLPNSVFVVDQSHRIRFRSERTQPVESVLRGRIEVVHRVVERDSTKRLHFLELSTDDGRASLFLTYFPMSTSLQISLRCGATIAVSNYQTLGQNGYSVSLRSSIEIVEFSSELSFVETSGLVYKYRKPKCSYESLWCRRLVKEQMNNLALPDVPPLDVTADVLLNLQKRKKSSQYRDFLCGKIPSCVPETKSLEAILRSASDELVQRLDRYCASHGIDPGWNASFHRSKQDYFTFGRISCKEGLLSISDDTVYLPMCGNHDRSNQGLAWVKVQCVVVSCLCLGLIPSEEFSALVPRRRFRYLPPFQANSCEPMGSSMLVVSTNRVFISSLFLICGEIRSTVPFLTNVSNTTKPCASLVACLQDGSMFQSSVAIEGLLVRTTYKIHQFKPNKAYNGCVMTIASIEDGELSTKRVSCLQSIEVKPTVSFTESQRILLRAAIDSFTGPVVKDELLTLCLLWWKLGNSSRSCALLVGGWDESRESTLGVLVHLPRTAVARDPKRGYCRFRASIDDLSAVIRWFKAPKQKTEPRIFDSLSDNSLVLPGGLDGRPARRGGFAFGEILYECRPSTAPANTIQELFRDLCLDIRGQDRARLAPSLVREIRGGSFLGVSFCQVWAECSKCYEALREPSRVNGKRSVTRKWDATGEEPGRRTTRLRCPNRCCVETYGSIKWECSGVLDDGTGQAKLYAEREIALCLLGMNRSTVDSIEKGAWLKEDGLTFSRTMPPKKFLSGAVLSARGEALERLRMYGRRRPLTDADVLACLTPAVRAEYELQRHCRFSKEPLRRLYYYVRCKPLSDSSALLGQTEVETSTGKDVSTYRLPPLKLNLIDCCVASDDPTFG